MSDLQILNPKHSSSSASGRASWYHYYPGFSTSFAYSLLQSSNLPSHAVVLDPWNGSGTTTSAASYLGHRGVGYDLNPVMVIAARARLLSRTEKSSLWPIACDIKVKAEAINLSSSMDEPLLSWMVPRSASLLRKIEIAVQQLLLEGKYESLVERDCFNTVSCLAAFYYTALFRTARALIRRFYASNPTWTKLPASKAHRIKPDWQTIIEMFSGQVQSMISHLENDPFVDSEAEVQVHKGSSEALPMADESVDLILSSPPYCTRIDYAVATRIELALLGFKHESTFDKLRRNLIGASTIGTIVPEPSASWGSTCETFLERLKKHTSKASHSYYYRNHLQYFDAMQRSLSEISRVMKQRSSCVLVVQDSFYKDIHNNLPQMIVEMSESNNLVLNQRKDFLLRRTMAGIHPGSKVYRNNFRATESVLCFSKT